MLKKALAFIFLIFGIVTAVPFLPGKATGIAIPIDQGVPIGELISVMGILSGNTYDFSNMEYDDINDFFDALELAYTKGEINFSSTLFAKFISVISDAIANNEQYVKVQLAIKQADLDNFVLQGLDIVSKAFVPIGGYEVSDYKNVATNYDSFNIIKYGGGIANVSVDSIMELVNSINVLFNGFILHPYTYSGTTGYLIIPSYVGSVDIYPNNDNELIASGMETNTNVAYILNGTTLRQISIGINFSPFQNGYYRYYNAQLPDMKDMIYYKNSVNLTLDGNRIYCDSGVRAPINVYPPANLNIPGYTDSAIGITTGDAVLDIGTALNIIEDAFDNARELTLDDFLDQIQEADGILEPGDVDDDTRAPAPPIPVIIKARNIPLDEPIGDTRPIESTINLPGFNTPENNHAFDGVTILSELIDATQKSAPEPLMVAFWSLVSILFILAIIEIAHK